MRACLTRSTRKLHCVYWLHAGQALFTVSFTFGIPFIFHNKIVLFCARSTRD